MGLDVSTKNERTRLNWGFLQRFEEWSLENLKVNPFPSWDGGNSTIVVFNRDPEHEREVKGDKKEAEKWLKAWDNYNKKIFEENEVYAADEFEAYAGEWARVLRDGVKNGSLSYM
jgi:hypothetical protein